MGIISIKSQEGPALVNIKTYIINVSARMRIKRITTLRLSNNSKVQIGHEQCTLT